MDGNGINNSDMNEKLDVMPLSDYSFLERSVHEVYIWIWFIIHVWRCDRFSALSWKRIFSLELKSFVTIFILFALPLESFYDIISTKIKYVEGFYMFVGMDDVIRAKPKWMWSEENQLWFIPSYYILMAGISFQTITLYLLQCFWNYLTNSIAKTSFMSRWEFALYIVWGIICVAMFPVLPYLLKNHDLLLEAVPQLVYAAQLFVLVLLGIRTHIKFLGLIEVSSSNKNSANLVAKIRYFVDMNKLLTAALALTSVAFFILSIDLLTSSKIINHSKFATDLLVAHVNFAAVIEWLALILIFYPRKGFVGTGAGGTSFNTNVGSSNIVATSQLSNQNNPKLFNVPPGTGAGISVIPVIPYSQNSISTISLGNNNNNNSNNNNNNNNIEKRPPLQQKSSSSALGKSSLDQVYNDYYQTIVKSNSDNSTDENSQKPLQKRSSFKRFKKKPSSQTPLSDSNSDLGNYSDNNEGNANNGSVPYLKRNISISRDGKMLYGETKPLGKVKGAEFVAVEKADPSFIPSYYFMNEIKDKNGNVYRVPSLINDRLGVDENSKAENSNRDVQQEDITQGMVQQEIIVPQQGTMQISNNDSNNNVIRSDEEDDDSDDGYFYAM